MRTETTFKAAWWLKNAHLQSIVPSLFRRVRIDGNIWRERLVTPDKDFIDIDFCGKGCQPLVILLHGLTGSSQSGYIKGLQRELYQQGFRSVVLNFRGCSGESNNTARCYHSGETEDIHFLYQTLRQREPNTPIAAIGFSLGGNVLLKWLGEQGNNLSLFCACAISVPLVLSECATKLDSGFSRVYRNSLIRELKQYVKAKRKHLLAANKHHEADKISQLGELSSIKSFWQYDDRVVAKLHGFLSADDYYKKSSSRYYLNAIAIPTLLIQAKDDPFMTQAVLPNKEELSFAISMETTERGGHVGFISGNNPLKPKYWLEERIPDFIKQHLPSI